MVPWSVFPTRLFRLIISLHHSCRQTKMIATWDNTSFVGTPLKNNANPTTPIFLVEPNDSSCQDDLSGKLHMTFVLSYYRPFTWSKRVSEIGQPINFISFFFNLFFNLPIFVGFLFFILIFQNISTIFKFCEIFKNSIFKICLSF